MRNFRYGLAAVGAVVAFASCAHAVTVGLAADETGYVDGRHAYIDPLTLDGNPWFCVSPDLEISLGSQNYVYTLSALTPANSAAITEHTLTAAQIGEVGALIGKGVADIRAHASGAALAADASAIWSVEGSTVKADNAATGALILQDVAWASGRSAPFVLMTNTDGVQNVGGVPEPAAWVLMMIGVGGIGALARRGRGVFGPAFAQAS